MLRAYELWGKDCSNQIIGEFVFFIWDARRRQLFAARDAAGVRHFYYASGKGWFAFASEIRGLLALQRIEPKLNESRLLDYLVPEFDRDDETGTFYREIDRLPAGHAMLVGTREIKLWRYWYPENLQAMRFTSLDECAEAFLAQLRVSVKCRLRSVGTIGSALSGGLDSSSIVCLIGEEFRNALSQPLRTFSLITDDRENCAEWLSIQQILKDDWFEPTIIAPENSLEACRAFVDAFPDADEPFLLTHGLFSFITHKAIAEKGCRIRLDGMAGDLLFYGPNHTLNAILRRKLYNWLPPCSRAFVFTNGTGDSQCWRVRL